MMGGIMMECVNVDDDDDDDNNDDDDSKTNVNRLKQYR